jgi:hypothetical protein
VTNPRKVDLDAELARAIERDSRLTYLEWCAAWRRRWMLGVGQVGG